MDFKKVSRYKNSGFDDVSLNDLREPVELAAYLYSGAVFKLSDSERESLLEDLKREYSDEGSILFFDFIEFSFRKADEYWQVALENSKFLCAEDILNQFEFLGSRMIARNVSIDGFQYSDDIIGSQHDFLVDVMPTILKFIQDSEIAFSKKPSCSKKSQTLKIIESLSYYKSIMINLNEVFKGGYEVKSIRFLCDKYNVSCEYRRRIESCCKFFMHRIPEDFDRLEAYRDLNYTLEYQEEKSRKKQYELMRNSGFAEFYDDSGFVRFDFSRGEDYKVDLQFHKVGEFLRQIYYSLDTLFSYNGDRFRVFDLVEVSKSIYEMTVRYRRRNTRDLKMKKSGFIFIRGRKSLYRELGLKEDLKILVDLFVTDNPREIENKPFFIVDGLFYMSPQSVEGFCFEKLIDKVLSSKEVNVLLPERVRKGDLFEERILGLFNSSGMESFSFKGKSNKGIPEIDAIVELDEDNLLLIEAKCTVKPESRAEAYSYVENHLQKARDQLVSRIKYLTHNSSEDSGDQSLSNVKGKNITPLIVTNHSYFTGMMLNTGGYGYVYCIDEFLLRKIINNKIIPSWRYLEEKESYGLEEINLNNSSEILNAIKHPVSFLNGKVHRTIQLLEYGVAFEISKNARVNWEYKYINGVQYE